MTKRQWTGRSTIKLYNGDCMEALAGMGENEYELAIVDPPYGIDVTKMNMGTESETQRTRKSHGTTEFPVESTSRCFLPHPSGRLSGAATTLNCRRVSTSPYGTRASQCMAAVLQNVVGYELDADYYAAACARLDKHIGQGQFDF